MAASVLALSTEIYILSSNRWLILLSFSKNDKCQLVMKTTPGD